MSALHGLVIGKFYPPHAGHHLVVRAAAAACDRVTVVVMAASVESLSLATRVEWMREVHESEANVTVTGVVDDVEVDLESDAVWRAHVDLMRQAVESVTEVPVDAVFTSEGYGDELGRRFGAVHAAIDPDRVLVPVSATAVRSDPAATWEHLAPCVRAGLARRVVVVGAESTGKTTLAAALTDRLRSRGRAHGLTRWVGEYGREYTLQALASARAEAVVAGRPLPRIEDLAWPTEAFVRIAVAQNELEDGAARVGGPVLVCDTDAFATGVWHERYTGQRSALVEAHGDRHRHALYLLTHPDDVPFVQDGVRDGEHLRRWMTDRFVERLTETGRRWAWIRGERAARLDRAEAEVDALLAEGPGLAPPLG